MLIEYIMAFVERVELKRLYYLQQIINENPKKCMDEWYNKETDKKKDNQSELKVKNMSELWLRINYIFNNLSPFQILVVNLEDSLLIHLFSNWKEKFVDFCSTITLTLISRIVIEDSGVFMQET